MPRLLFLQPLCALADAFRAVQRVVGLALLVACATAGAQAPAEWAGDEGQSSWYATEVEADVALQDHPWVEHAVVDAADTQAWETGDMPRCHKPANSGGNTFLASDGGAIGVPPRAAPVQIHLAQSEPTTLFPLAQPQRIVQPPRRPPRLA
jgi:hypothetical protein